MDNFLHFYAFMASPEISDLAYRLYELMKEFNYTPSQMKGALDIAIQLWKDESSNFISSANQ